jgi:hypothetical protein
LNTSGAAYTDVPFLKVSDDEVSLML